MPQACSPDIFENSVAELLDGMGCYSELALRRALRNSSMLSSDVSAGYDPAYGEALRKRMQHILDVVLFLTSSPEQEENPVPTMPMQSTLQEFAGFLMITMLLSRQQSLERLILVEAEPLLILRHFTEWRLLTVAWQC